MLKVALAIITDESSRMLVTQRPLHVPHGGFWEFPGGKLETHETAEDALVREIKEELGIEITDYVYLGDVVHQYSNYPVQLLVFHITQYKGTPACLEGQTNIKWVLKEEVNPFDFPEANRAVLGLI